MMDPDEWTPSIGWLIALRRLAIACGVVFVVAVGLLYLARMLGERIWAPGIGWYAACFAASGLPGWPMGYFTAWKLPDKSGLAGPALLPAAGACLLAAHVGAALVSTLAGPMNGTLFLFAGGMVFWSLAACVKTLILD